jgi:fermentation-respiration switch protein FrsA (DUF1100 family)
MSVLKSVHLVAAAAAAATFTFTAAEAATSKRVVFESHGERLVGDLFLPDDYQPGARLPAIVVTGAWMTVKEQMPARYAAELADRGYAALAFDFRGWGQSEGERRQFEDPATKISDIRAAFAYLATRPEVDPDRIGGLGICASAGYMAHAVTGAGQVRSVALVAPWLHDQDIVEATYGGPEGVAKLLAAGDAAENAHRSSRRQAFVPAASRTDTRAVMFEAPYYTEEDRGLIPEWRNEVDPGFWRSWLSFDAQAAAPRLTQPFAMVHSSAAAIPQGARAFYARLSGNKRELWLDGVSQFDFYDRDDPVRRSADFVAGHFAETLR